MHLQVERISLHVIFYNRQEENGDKESHRGSVAFAGMIERHGLARASRELLVGFRPLHHYVAALQDRLGHLGTICADFTGGCTMALRWHPQVACNRAVVDLYT